MRALTASMINLLAAVRTYLERGKYKISFKIFLIIIGALSIYAAGERLGEFLFYITNKNLF
ncbi:hypothetical protein GCM10007383_00850 [Arenibacter certesii]|uniref:Uncharacterized protein n=1 Tax=Arenibacter certesii TaxID=228955 RepID=A0A918IN57_9FLAO|nr:hypothetical protein GCM10007383_00850 [Arenibacter certesii]